jgi:hypothetical protein
MITTLAAALLAASPSVASMQWERRVLIVAASSVDDPRLLEQRRMLAAWRDEAELRDLSVVEVVGDRVAGVSDTAAMLRRAYGLPVSSFAVALLGKDGGVKRRASEPLAAADLARTIDSMPMRRAGGR